MATNLYEILELNKNATKEEIKASYKRLALKYHPDKNKHPEAEERFKEISEAYKVLSDDDNRKTYDRLEATFEGGFDNSFAFYALIGFFAVLGLTGLVVLIKRMMSSRERETEQRTEN